MIDYKLVIFNKCLIKYALIRPYKRLLIISIKIDYIYVFRNAFSMQSNKYNILQLHDFNV